MPEINFKLLLITDGADGKLHAVQQNLDEVKRKAETPTEVKLNAEKSLATIRDLGLAVGSVFTAISKLTSGINGFMDASLGARQSQTLANLAFKDGAKEIQEFAGSMQDLTNFEDDQLTALMSKLAMTFKLNKDQAAELTPLLLDFTEATKSTGMTVESAFDLMGKALNGHTEMLGRYGIELDKTRLQTEGVSYLVEKLGEDYGGTATALADLRLQNINAWGDIKETVGSMLDVLIKPLLAGLKNLMDWFQELPKGLQGLIAGLALAVPTIIAVATAITTLVAAFTALKAAINPVAGIMSLIVGGLTAASVAIAATAVSTNAAAESQISLAEEIKNAKTEVSLEAEKFNVLATSLLEFKSKSQLTRDEKQNMLNIIRSLNENYGEYLGNINLETAGYNELTIALNAASNALVSQQIAKIYGQRYQQYVDQVAQLTIKLKEQQPEYERLKAKRDALFASFPANAMESGAGFNPDAWTNGEWTAVNNQLTRMGNVSAQLVKAKSELSSFANAYREAVQSAGDLSFGGAGGGSTGDGGSSPEVNDYENLMAELQRLRNTELQNLEADYQKKLAIIKQYTAEESQEQINAIRELDNWKTAEEQKISDKMSLLQAEAADKQKQLTQEKFRSEVQYYANLEQLGVASYDAMKKTMEEYYAWAKENLSKEEAAAVLVQLRETNLRWGQVKNREYEEQLAMAQTRDDFRARDLELSGNSYQLQLNALDAFYASRRQKLLEAGITEQEIEKQKAKALMQLQINSASQAAKGVGSILGNLAAMQDKESESGFKTWKALALAQAMVDMPAAALAAYKSMSGIPVVGPALGIAAAAAAGAMGLKNISEINKAKFEKKAEGGLLEGPSHAAGGTIIEAEGGEYITRKSRVAQLGKGFFDFINNAPLAAVKTLFTGIPSGFSIPMPADSYRYAGGGQVATGGNSTLDAILAAIMQMSAKLPTQIVIHIDPLSSDPVRISEIAEQGTLIRSAT